MSELAKVTSLLAVIVAAACVCIVAFSSNKQSNQMPPVPSANQMVVTNSAASALCQIATNNGCELLFCWQGNEVVSVVPMAPCSGHVPKP